MRNRRIGSLEKLARRAGAWASWSLLVLAAVAAGRMALAEPAHAQTPQSFLGEPPASAGRVFAEAGPAAARLNAAQAFYVSPFEAGEGGGGAFDLGAFGQPVGFASRIRDELDIAFDSGDFVGLAVVVMQGPDIALMRTYGETEAGSREDVTPHTVFRFASLSKGFASTVVGQLVEEGSLSWNDRVADRVPEFRLNSAGATRMVTLENLLSHRVGLPNHAFDNYLESGESMSRLLRRTSQASLSCVPGECHSYQNITYSLAGNVIESVDGRSFDSALSNRIFSPLGMGDASVGLDELRSSASWARPHTRRRRSDAWEPFQPNNSYYRVAAAGGLNGSISDLAQWLRAQMGYRPDVVSADVLERLHRPLVDTPRQSRQLRWMNERLRDTDYALGWRVYDYAGERLVYHAGGVAGYRAFVGFLPEHDLGFAVLWNSRSGRGWRIMPAIMDAYLGYEDEDWLGLEDILATREAMPESRILSVAP